MDKITVHLIFTQEEAERLLQMLELLRNDPDAAHLSSRINTQLFPENI